MYRMCDAWMMLQFPRARDVRAGDGRGVSCRAGEATRRGARYHGAAATARPATRGGRARRPRGQYSYIYT